MTCKNCSYEVTQNYCPNCGQPAKLKRIDAHYIQHEIEHILHFEKGIFYTVKELLIRPGENVREFISDNRSRLVKPIIFIIISSLIYSVINHFFHLEDGYVNYQEDTKSTTGAIFAWVQNHYGYANIIMGVFIALWLKLFFKKSNYNFFEILILLCFIMGVAMLLYSVFAIFQGLTKVDLMQFGGILSFIYCSWAIAQFFDNGKMASILKACIAYMFGVITFTCSAMLLGFLVDQIVKH
ncbi:DUF3667 domain-containing protein [Dyadobacter psychrotolerans]|uniref:DUF3667 domain-containing protein n=1 Tax=Dyadobacter psychrotolerans TaxID=2541721 RepID=A0A4R5E2L8_9BACT|nr:DUF3667 domain-containing protein [Dyadobacter psychrotolerans]TDE18403.1 DUF3667 domain-containing protein [Dyadobacter psychrotolerans]